LSTNSAAASFERTEPKKPRDDDDGDEGNDDDGTDRGRRMRKQSATSSSTTEEESTLNMLCFPSKVEQHSAWEHDASIANSSNDMRGLPQH
jgi:hypothetical protein